MNNRNDMLGEEIGMYLPITFMGQNELDYIAVTTNLQMSEAYTTRFISHSWFMAIESC